MNNLILVGIIAIAFVLVIIAFIVVYKSSHRPKEVSIYKDEVNENKIYFDDLLEIVKNPNTDSKTLLNTLTLFNKEFSIDDKNAQKYMVFLSRVLTHSNVNKEIFQYFHREVKNKNKMYKVELNKIEEKALG